ncbi:hypothetical protein VFPPC_12275 [Pochonia chlamydosporia 170]|uniref:Uncharacterized protein n=1 Tax=Pochonia chlamydosporia 170 TaxID=1380566 RepID=A0A179F0T2_METCM|nr:hypothetical protein VFPPC_12275 [Pochonia chlamydosporia 170]OAQ59075.1 hypothetical protein VFPPC_12275 [Pochonia chlamydosporia 170]
MQPSLRVTPPQSFRSSPPPTPPPTVKKASDATARIIAKIKARRSGLSSSNEPWVSYPLSEDQYTELTQQVQSDASLRGYVNQDLRHDFIPSVGRLVFRMPTYLHEWVISSVVEEVSRQLRVIGAGDSAAAAFARAVVARGSPTLDFTETGFGRHDPDAQFRHLDAQYPGVVMEVSYSQKQKYTPYIAEDCILGSDGDIRRVVVMDIGYPNSKKATMSSWKPSVVLNEAGELELIAEQTIVDMIFRDEEGNPNPNEEAGLTLQLRDFATETLSGPDLTESIRIPASKLYSYLTEAEKNMAKLKQKQGAVRETRPWVRKRRRLETPPEELDDNREAKFRKIEEKAISQAEKDDSSYKTTPDEEWSLE